MTDRGHLFVTAGDITSLACDAVLIPTDRRFHITQSFREVVGLGRAGCLEGHDWGTNLVVPFNRQPDDCPAIWLGNVETNLDPDRHVAAVAAEYAQMAAESARTRTSTRRPLLALPLFGTGEGGFAHAKGHVVGALMSQLAECVDDGIDVVLVTWRPASYAAAQSVRYALLTRNDSRADAFDLGHDEVGVRDAELTSTAERLADRARKGELVLFFGAGVSAAAGSPAWQDLLLGMASRLPADDSLSPDDLEGRDYRDQATILRRRFGSAEAFHTSLREQLSHSLHGLTHELLASLPCRENITTNYDQLFEQAVGEATGPLAVVPGEQVEPSQRWLLKLHGDIGSESSIILTRDDYLRVPQTGRALFGIVQAMLMTKHMLFVGYSLSDEDFHQLVHEVRLARGDQSVDGQRFGTVVTLFDDRVFHELWSADLDVVAMCPRPADPRRPTEAEVAHAARRLQIFLDLVGVLSADRQAFLLDPTYADLLSDEEEEFGTIMGQVAAQRPLEGGEPWERVDRLLELLGFPMD